MANDIEHPNVITRREAVRRVSALLGGVALVGGSSLLASIVYATTWTVLAVVICRELDRRRIYLKI